ncbi:MAG TPA: RagB/SusD family nutrient uptake outer membrane protein [Prevotella sp.]|nr:RagB/SusD family nutrient uptake outer membrane protein [Prevotella sp.]
MKINKYLSVLALASLLFGATSCSDYIDIDPENSVPEEKVDYTNLDNMYMPVSGVYAKVRTGAMHWVIWPLSIVRDGDVWSGKPDDQAPLVDMGNYNYDQGFWGLNEMWNQYYGIIKVANSALESLDEYAVYATTDAQKATNRSYQGEVKFLRAYAYYRLVQAFGPVTILRSNTQTNLTRSTIEAVNKYMLEDLEYAYNNCPEVRPNEMAHIGAVSAYSAKALAAKVYLNMGQYDQVEKLTDDIINSRKFELYGDFYQLFKIPGKLCDESLFECQCTDFGQGSGEMVDADQWFNFQGPSLQGPSISVGGWGFIGYSDEFKAWAESRNEDVRATTTFLVGGTTTPSGDFIKPQQNSIRTNCWNGKAYTPTNQMTEGRTKYGSNNNIRVLRYADVLLMNAEAKVKLGKNGDEPFNEVRRRAHMPELTNVTFDQILDERRMELCCEWGERYNDLIRTGKAAEVLGPKGWTVEKTYYPLPLDQITDNADLKNDPIN